MSNEKWTHLANVLFRTWIPGTDDKKGRYVTKKFDEVAMPVPKQRWSIDGVRKAGREAAGAITSNDGLTAYVPFYPSMTAAWKRVCSELEVKHGPEVLQSEHLQQLSINVWADKHRARGCRTGVTTIASRVGLPFLSLSNSMHCAQYLSYSECDDSNEDLQIFAKYTLDELNSIFKSGGTTIDGKWLPVQPSLSADGALIRSSYCNGSFLGEFPCPFCEIKLQDLVEYDIEFLKSTEQRTIQSIRRNSHRQSSGTEKCKGCDLWVCETEDEVREKGGEQHAIRVCRGDATDPEIPRGKQNMTKTILVDGKETRVKRSWQQWHKNTKYGLELVWWIEPVWVAICVLHWELQTTPLLIQGLVARHLDPKWKEAREGPQTGVLCALVSHFGRDIIPLDEPATFPALTGRRALYGRHGTLAKGVKLDGNTSRNWHAGFGEVLKVTFHDRMENSRFGRQRAKQYKDAVEILKRYQVRFFLQLLFTITRIYG